MRKVTQYLYENLLVSITLCFIAGIVLSRENRYAAAGLEFLPALVIVLLVPACTLYILKRHKPVVWIILLIAAIIGFQHNRVAMQPPSSQSHIFNRITEKTDIVLIATLMEMITFNGRNSRALLHATSIRFGSSSKPLVTSGKILLNFNGYWPKDHKAGDTLAIRCTVRRPDTFKTPGAFDYRRYLATQDIWITGTIKSPIFIRKVVQQQSVYHKLRFLPERIRAQIGNQLDDSLEGDSLSIYRAILLGDRSLIDPAATLEAFKGSGTTHILAISGIHMAVIGTLLYTLIFWILSRFEYLLLRYTVRKWAAFLCIPILVGYSLITGMNAPVTRAVIMSTIVILAILTNRKKSSAPLVALAALALLLANPLQLYSVSFQLSFSAIISILFILPVLKNIVVLPKETPQAKISFQKRIGSWLLAAFLVSLTATVATAPLVLSHFNRISLIGPIANLIIEPLICLWSLPLGFISIPFSFVLPDISTFFLQVGSYGIQLAITAATFFSSLSFSSMWLPTPPLWVISLYYLSLLVLASQRDGKTTLSIAAFGTLFLTIIFILGQDAIIRKRPSTFQISYLDVGQGSSTLLEDSAGQRILIDGGGSSLGSQTVGERIIAPFLWQKGIRSIDAIIVTHPDADHYNGLEVILKHFSPKLIWVRDRHGHDKNFENFIKLSEKQGIRLVTPAAGQLLEIMKVHVQCVENLTAKSSSSRNRGIVVRVSDQNIFALFPGDIEKSAEQHLINKGLDLRADILLSPHHGSKTSNSREFLTAVAPQHLIVSAAHYAKGRFPHSGLEEDSAQLDATLLSTASHGTITVASSKNGYEIFKTAQMNDNIFCPFEPALIEIYRRDGANTTLPSHQE